MTTRIAILTTMVLAFSQVADAQDKFSVELRGGASFPTEKLAGTELNTGFGFEGLVGYRIMKHVGVFVGWGWNRSSTDAFLTLGEIDVEETGYIYGLEFNHPIKDGPLAIYVNAAGLYDHLELENTDGEIIYDTGHGFGYRLGIGVDWELGSGWHLRPGAKYQALSRDMEEAGITTSLDHNYIGAGIGIMKMF